MDAQPIEQGLRRLFQDEGHRLVFWNDPDREFEEILANLNLEAVTLLRLDEHPALAVKVRLEQEDPTGRYLLYAPASRRNPSRTGYSTSASTARASGPTVPPCCWRSWALLSRRCVRIWRNGPNFLPVGSGWSG